MVEGRNLLELEQSRVTDRKNNAPPTPQLMLYTQYLILCVPKVVKGNLRVCVYQRD